MHGELDFSGFELKDWGRGEALLEGPCSSSIFYSGLELCSGKVPIAEILMIGQAKGFGSGSSCTLEELLVSFDLHIKGPGG